MKQSIFIFLFIICSCSNEVSEKDLKHLNGYWEIYRVESVNKKITEFKVNSTIDFYFIDNENKGYRKKTSLDFSGVYKTNNIKDKVIIENKNGAYLLKTKTALNNWEDRIINLTPEKLVLKNKKGDVFYYKKHKKLNIN
jgi:hypothetical protein